MHMTLTKRQLASAKLDRLLREERILNKAARETDLLAAVTLVDVAAALRNVAKHYRNDVAPLLRGDAKEIAKAKAWRRAADRLEQAADAIVTIADPTEQEVK
jgi:hypothetical protein